LHLGEYDVFLMGLLRRNWKKLVEPSRKYDDDVVKEFYANAWVERQEREERKTMVRGRWISYSPQAIDNLLGNPFPDQSDKCDFQKLQSKRRGFSNRKVVVVLCIPEKGYQIAPSGKKTKIRRYMRTLAQVWLTFMMSNVIPIRHVSNVNMLRCNLLFSMMQDDYIINIARIISYKLQRFINWDRITGSERMGTLGFPTLITALC